MNGVATVETLATWVTSDSSFGPGGDDPDAMWSRVERCAERWRDAIESWTLWMRAGGVAAGTIDKRRYQICRFAEHHLHTSPWKVSTDQLAAWLSDQQWAPETRKSFRTGIRAFYDWAVLTGRIKQSPAAILPAVRIPRAQPRPTPDQPFHNALQSSDDRTRLILLLGAYAGLRRGEMAVLRWSDVDVDSIRITGKGGHVRLIPLHEVLKEALNVERSRRLAGGAGSGFRYKRDLDVYVFPGRYGGPSTSDAIGRCVARVLPAGWSAHTLRHRFATRVYAGTRDLLAVQDLLGHASPETTRRYTQTPDGALRAAVDTL